MRDRLADERAGRAVLSELRSRKGFRQVIDDCDAGVVGELVGALGRAALDAASKEDQ
jgi:hypothetical protein